MPIIQNGKETENKYTLIAAIEITNVSNLVEANKTALSIVQEMLKPENRTNAEKVKLINYTVNPPEQKK